MATKADDLVGTRVLPRTLAGATVLQIVPSLHDDADARATLDIARALIHAGARSIVAAGDGELVDELKSFGGEWMPYAHAALNRMRLQRNAERLADFVAAERVDLIHAKTASAVWSARQSRGMRLVADLPEPRNGWTALTSPYIAAIAGVDRVIARSLFNATPLIERYGIPPERVSVIPRSIDSAAFDPATVQPARVAALRQAWGIPSGVRIVLVPGTVSPDNGQIQLIEAARVLLDQHETNVTVVLAGDDRRHRRYVRSIMQRAQQAGVDALFRIAGHVDDMPGAYAAADIVVLPAAKPPADELLLAEAQAMARPVIVSSIGSLPEFVLAPPRTPDEQRTGWVVPPGDAAEFARAIAAVLALDAEAYRALAARARQYGDFMFAQPRVAAATLAAYSATLEAETVDWAAEPALE
jgi:glycosyltransferase involved in cell wall biosynthesis